MTPDVTALAEEARRVMGRAFFEFAAQHEDVDPLVVITAWTMAAWCTLEGTREFAASLQEAGGNADVVREALHLKPEVWDEVQRLYSAAKLKVAHPENRA